jgi:hypothetical protein
MKSRLIGVVSLVTLVLVVFWVVLLIWGVMRGNTVETLDQALDHARHRDAVFALTYINAVSVTLSATALFGALYVFFRAAEPAASVMGVIFVPVYCALNVVVYGSQVTVIPQLVELTAVPGYESEAAFFLGQMVHAWPDSTIAVLNSLAYAVLGIPSLVFGLLLYRGEAARRMAGALLALNAVACFAGPIGLTTGLSILEIGTLLGGGIFLLALFPLSIAFLRQGDANT